MARTVNIGLCKTNQAKVDKWLAKYQKTINLSEDDYNYFIQFLNNLIQRDVYSLKACSEKNIVEFYLEYLNNDLNKNQIEIYNKLYWDNVKKKVRAKLANKYTSGKFFNNNIDIYFNEVKGEYIKTPYNESDNLEFCEENYNVFIKNNLKLVIECAKRYQNLGLPFEDLIQAGNMGLLMCLKKYKKSKANLRVAMLNLLEQSNLTSFTYEQSLKLVNKAFTYSKNLDVTINKLPKSGFKNKLEFEIWINNTIKPASFASAVPALIT